MTESPLPDPLPFTPVPVAHRRNGWTPERQRRFIAVLTATGVVTVAARAVGKSGTSAYKLRERAGAESFARAWDAAQQMAGDRAFATAIDRAVNGVEVPRYYRGKLIRTERRLDFRLAYKVLDHHLASMRRSPVDLETAISRLECSDE